MLRLSYYAECWPISGHFSIARGSKTVAETILVILDDGVYQGRGESVPYLRYGETIANTLSALEAARPIIEQNDLDPHQLSDLISHRAACNAVDCALWDLQSKRSGRPIWEILGGNNPAQALITAFTISLDEADKMAQSAAQAADRPLLKIKLGSPFGDEDRLHAVRQAAPRSRLIIDANEGWGTHNLVNMLELCANLNVELIEQPLPETHDTFLRSIVHKVAICADESACTIQDLDTLHGKYDAVNIKLDKTGGLTGALAMMKSAKSLGFKIMVGSMVATSLAIAPASILAQDADYVDLDGPLLLKRDRVPGLLYEGSLLYPPQSILWG